MLDINDLQPGDTFLTPGRKETECIVTGVNIAADTITASHNGLKFTYPVRIWNMGGYVKNSTAAPAAPGRKQVSHNGKDWCDYRLLLDADPFESYEHRREI